MSTIRDRLRANINRFFITLDAVGTTVTFTSVSNTTYNPATGAVSSSTSTTDVTAFLMRFKHQYVDGVTIQREDVRCLFSSSDGFTPDPDDRVTIDSVDYLILNIRKDITDAYWDLHLRKK